MGRNIGNLVDPEQQLHTASIPDSDSLLVNVNKHLANIQENVMGGYSELMSTIQANEQAHMADYQYKMKKAQMQAESGSGGSGLASALGDISKTLLQAYDGFQKTDLLNKELDLKATQIENEVKSSEEQARQKQEIEQAKAQAEETKAVFIQTIDGMVTKTQEFIRTYGYTEGVNKAQAQMDAMFEMPEFKNLPPDMRVQVITYYRGHFGDIQAKQTDVAVQKQKEYEAEQADYDTTYIRNNFAASAFADIENGIDPDAAVTKLEEGVRAWEQSIVEKTGKPIDAAYKMKVLNPIYADLAVRLEKMYGERAKNFGVAGKYMELSEYSQGMYLAQQQQVENPSTGRPFTEAEVRTLVNQKAIELGIPSFVDQLEYTPDKITQRQITRLEQDRNLEALLNSNDSPVDPKSIIGQRSLNASTGGVLYSYVNRDAGSISYVAHIKNHRDQYPAHLQNIPELADDFNSDRKSYVDIGKQLLELERKSLEISKQVDPEILGERRVLVPPNEELRTPGGYVTVSGSPSPSALPEERESLLKEMEALKSQQVEIQAKWAAYGLDVTNPANRSYLDQMDAETAGVRAEADKRGIERINQDAGRNGGATVLPDPKQSRLQAVQAASRASRPEKWDSNGNLYDARVRQNNLEDTQRQITQKTGSQEMGVYVARGVVQRDRLLDSLEGKLAAGVDPTVALRQVTEEYNKVLKEGITPTMPLRMNINNEEVGAESYKNKLNSQFMTQAKGIVSTYQAKMRQQATPNRSAVPPRNPSGGSTTTTPSRDYPMSNSEYERRNGMVSPLQGSNHQITRPDTSHGLPNAVTYEATGKQNVNALSDGRVVYIGTQNGKPITIIKTHNGLYEGYVGIEQQYRKVGDTVKANSPLGSVGNNSSSRKPLSNSIKNPIRDTSVIKVDQDYATREGQENKYRDHRGIDIMVPEGTKVYSPVEGTIVYSEPGHTVNKEDSMTSQPGMQPQNSVLIKLDKPINYNGKNYNMVYVTHLGGLSGLQPGQRVSSETQIGISGTAGGAAHIHLGVVGDRGQTVYIPEGTLYQQLLSKDQAPSNLSMVVWGTNPVLQNGILSPNTVSAEQYLQTKTGAYYPPNNRNKQGQSSNSIFRLSKTTVLLPNGKILDLATNTVRMPTQSEASARDGGYKPSVTKVGGLLSTNSADYGTGVNNPDEDYGYKIFRDDPEFRKEVAKLADEIGIPAVFIADLMQVETADWTHTKRANSSGHFGLIQINATNAKAYANMTHTQIANLSLAQQVRLVVRPFLLAMQREAGKPIRTMEDLVFAVWRGNPGLKMNDQQRARVRDGANTAQWYMDKMGKAAGRQYNHFLRRNSGRTLHKNPRSGCPQCQAMKSKGSFVVHYG